LLLLLRRAVHLSEIPARVNEKNDFKNMATQESKGGKEEVLKNKGLLLVSKEAQSTKRLKSEEEEK